LPSIHISAVPVVDLLIPPLAGRAEEFIEMKILSCGADAD
jgi:hypothetical protein